MHFKNKTNDIKETNYLKHKYMYTADEFFRLHKTIINIDILVFPIPLFDNLFKRKIMVIIII